MSDYIERQVKILIPEDSANKGKEQYMDFQKDGRTVKVPLNRLVDVPYWVAMRAVEIGLVSESFLPEDIKGIMNKSDREEN